jgi:hypothetical protein
MKQPTQQQQQPLRLHWSPVEPSWIVAIGLILLAVLPHQIPRIGRSILRHPAGALAFAVIAAFVTYKVPVLGAAMFLFLAAVLLAATTTEYFAPMVLNKEEIDKKEKKQRWLNEEILSELPDAIQEKSDSTYLNYDKVTEQESGQWAAEDMLDEHPVGIQDRTISTDPEYDTSSSRSSMSHR